MTGVPIQTEDLGTETDREDQVQRCREKTATYKPRNTWGPQKLGDRPGADPSPCPQRGPALADTVVWDSWPPELWVNELRLCSLQQLQRTSAVGDKVVATPQGLCGDAARMGTPGGSRSQGPCI